MVEGKFEQTTTPLGFLRSILGRYPFSVGFIREILANAADAGASRFILVLDTRNHQTTSSHDLDLFGPALLAFNDEKFVEEDWRALQYAYESSKVDNSSKIGKYGVGFRSVFHVTDCPQIISGKDFAMFDPCEHMGSTGFKKELSTLSPSELAPFGYFSELFSAEGFDGTVIRCPLRSKPSRIASKVVHTGDILELFRNFITEEIDISLLFLQNIKALDVHQIDENGSTTCLAKLSISRSAINTEVMDIQTHLATTTTIRYTNSLQTTKTRSWRIMHCPFSTEEAVRLVSEEFLGNATSILKHHKLSPDITIALPQDSSLVEKMSGRLFTFLPLPIFTRFPVHVHALFALTESRQNLRNPQEIGIVDGSDDQMLIKWNRLLFEHYIPQAWKLMLESLVASQGEIDILAIWPPNQGPATSGEAVYWQSLPSNLLNVLTSVQSPTWPLYTPRGVISSNAKYMPLHLLITADPSIPIRVLDALTLMGLHLLRPPAYICNLIASTNNFSMLTPEVAHDALLQVEMSKFESIPKETRSTVLEYLLSTRNVDNIIGLPLVLTSNGQAISLCSKSADSDAKAHIMLNKMEYEIFGACDENAIPLQNLSPRVVEILQTLGPNHLNVERLDVHHIVDYLVLHSESLGLDPSLAAVDQRAIKWLSTFWVWMGTYAKKKELFLKIRHLYLLPSTQGLRMANRPLFKAIGEHPSLIEPLSILGISFLDRGVQLGAHNTIESFDLLKRITDVHALLNLLPETVPPGAQSIPLSSCLSVLTHMGIYAPSSCSHHGKIFDDAQLDRLRMFPIFPLATFPRGNSGIVVENASIPDGISLIAIETPPFLPSLPRKSFIQLNKALPVLDYLDWRAKKSSAMDILELTVTDFISQEDYVQAAALEFLLRNRHNVPPIVTENLRNLHFVLVKDGSRRRPIDVIDPGSKLAELFEESPERRAEAETESQKKILRSLQDLNMMQRELTLDVAQDRINFISESTSANAINISRSFLSLVISSRLDCSGLQGAADKRWLPTNQGLKTSSECRDTSSTSPLLFDRVLASLEPFKIPSSLKHVLGWDQPLPVEVLTQQLQHILHDGSSDSDDTFSKVTNVLKELSSRDCTPEQITVLKTATSGKKWVPTTDHQLTETQNALLQAHISESGFHRALCPDSKMRMFFERMGCTNKPAIEAVVEILTALKSQPISANSINTSLNALRSLSEHPDDDQRSLLLVPDETGCLQPFDDVYFNDIGDHAKLIKSETTFIAHNLLEESLAIRLGLGRLGLKHKEFSEPYIDMGQDIVTIIRNNLKHYTDQQIVTEFLANAIDANATEFSMLVNKYCLSEQECTRALSEKMRTFCTCPSLVIHNNSTFSENDFIGIRRTGIGGKDGNRETIGHFGLGALTMFHLAELAIIISNGHVLFLDPSKEHLPVSNTASLLLPLNNVRKFYPSHLAPVDGLFGFEISNDEPYQGTIFILPLRIWEHLEGYSNYISHQIYTVDILEQEILENFRRRASSCFLFTTITKIAGLAREESRSTHVLWSFSAQRSIQEDETVTGCLATEITITDNKLDALESRWRVATRRLEEDAIPQEILSSLSNYRLRIPVILGLAFLLEDGLHESRSFGFFSTLPLGIETSLPCHVMGSFLLSSDRRSIRHDEYGTESKFNIWLLSVGLPRLYLFLLQVSLDHGDNKWHWWPGRHRSADAYSRILIDSFYSKHLKLSDRRVFFNEIRPEHPLTPQEVVLSGEEPPNIERLLSKLQCEAVIRPHKSIYHLMASKSELQLVNPSFVKSVVMQAPVFVFAEWDFKIIEDCIVYLLGKENTTSNLLGLAIVPLEDETFGTFQDRSNVDAECYYIWLPHKATKKHNFSLRKFIHPNIKAKVRETLLKSELNIIPLDTSIMVHLIGEMLPSQSFSPDLDYRIEVPMRVSNWIFNFWDSWPEYVRLGLSSNDISSFPLVATVRPSWYTSLASFQHGHSLFIEGDDEYFEDIRYFLDKLDVNVVRHSSSEEIPRALYDILTGHDYPVFDIETALNALYGRHHSTNLSDYLHECDFEKQVVFAEWARNNMGRTIPAQLQPVAQQLPIWLSARKNSAEPELRPATDIYMLPGGIPFDATARFMDVYVAEYGNLQYCNGPKLTHIQLREHLDLPAELSTLDLPFYRTFLQLWLPQLRDERSSEPTAIDIPNANRIIQPSDALYAREDLFEMAFGPDSPLFIHEDFRPLEPSLYRHGLKTQTLLDIDMFSECASAFESGLTDQNVTPQQISRANALFDAYGYSLPMCIPQDESHRWSELDDFSFIPRNTARRRLLRTQSPSVLGLELPDNVTSLPVIVSPADLVRADFEAVAWTQRGTFERQPDQRVILAYPNLGRPSVTEVIIHLRNLSTLTELSHSQREIVIHDLQASYKFLDENYNSNVDVEDPTNSILRTENLFLNVNDPSVDSWRWDKAEELVFETHDIDKSIRHVRNFLLPFRKLLQASGALQIYYPEYPAASHPSSDAPNSKLLAIRSGFQELRKKNALTDVLFLTNNDDDDEDEDGHDDDDSEDGHDDDDEEDGHDDDDDEDRHDDVPLTAHRSFLAVNSDYFSDLFSKGYKEAGEASTSNPVEINLDVRRKSAKAVLDYIYTEERPDVEALRLSLVLEIFALSEYWKVSELFDYMQKEIAVKLLKPRSLDEVRNAVTNIPGAENLLQACNDYEENNQALMARFR